jgi:hypothetical protein
MRFVWLGLAIGLIVVLAGTSRAEDSPMHREYIAQALERWKTKRTAEDFLLLVAYMKTLPETTGRLGTRAEAVFGKYDDLRAWSMPIGVDYVLSDGRIGRIVHMDGRMDTKLPAGVILPPR